MEHYISRLDEIDKWLFDSFGILPGACCSTENLRYTTARMVAEVLWPKKDLALTWEDIRKIVTIADDLCNEWGSVLLVNESQEAYYNEILRRFGELKA